MNKKLLFSAVALSLNLAAAGIMPLAAGAQAAPTVSYISPTSVMAGSANTTLLVYGTNFVPGSIVYFNGLPIATTYVSANTLSATIPSSVLTTAISDAVSVLNPGGIMSYLPNSPLFTITPASTNTTPGLPDTGFNPSNSIGLNITALFGAIVASVALLFLGIQMKRLFSPGR